MHRVSVGNFACDLDDILWISRVDSPHWPRHVVHFRSGEEVTISAREDSSTGDKLTVLYLEQKDEKLED